MSFSSWLCQFPCLFLQAEIKSRVAIREQTQTSGRDLGESPWFAPTSDHSPSESFGRSFREGRGSGVRGLVKGDAGPAFKSLWIVTQAGTATRPHPPLASI